MLAMPPLSDAMRQSFGNDDHRLAAPALRAFTRIASAWSLTAQEQSAILGRPVDVACSKLDARTVHGDWPEMLQRISFVLGIYAALHTLFPDQQQADGWIRRPNAGAPFKGEPALALMCTGRLGDLEIVREYLDGQGTYQPS